MISKKRAREDASTKEPEVIWLNEYADLEEEEYEEMMESLEPPPETWADLLGEVAAFT